MNRTHHPGGGKDRETIAATAARWVARRDAGLTAKEEAELTTWLAASAMHMAAFAHYFETWSVLGGKGDAPARSGAVVRELGVRRERRGRKRLRSALVTTALIVMLGMWWGPLADSEHEKTTLAREYLVPEVQLLSDGSVVVLRRGAEIEARFASATDRVRRVVLRRGEAHFQVAKDATRPFVVETSGVEVRAVGTAFAVMETRGAVEILVTEGRVAVEQTKDLVATVDASARVVVPVVAAGSKPVTAEPEPVTAEERDTRLAWRFPRIEFSDTPLARAIMLMNTAPRTPGEGPRPRLTLDREAAALGREPVSGLFRAGNAEAFVRVLELSLGVEAERNGDEIVLRKGK
ncbi:MAG: FecR domain-containing protein [Verrucomicrobiota bacterium]